MKLKLKNVGKIEDAEIELNGMTIIAGENNTGKSTIGKMLFCIFHSFFKIEEQIREERRTTIIRAIINYYYDLTHRWIPKNVSIKFAEHIIEHKDMFINDTNILIQELERFYLSIANNQEKNMHYTSLNQLAQKIHSYLLVEDTEIAKIILQQRLNAEFSMKICHVNQLDEPAAIELKIKNDQINFEIRKNEEIIINNYFSLFNKIIYIDDPFVLDRKQHSSFEHNGDLSAKLSDCAKQSEFSAIDEFINKQKTEKIFKTMNSICDGELTIDENGTYIFKNKELKDFLDMSNLSTGMKSFVILKELLQNGSIEENSILILDEPEIHLHPEWQIKFAEIVVLIQQEFGTNILLNTHSPYFLNAIEVYSTKYGITEKCKYYMTIENNGKANIKDVTKNLEYIYEKLAKPLQELENLEYRNGNTF